MVISSQVRVRENGVIDIRDRDNARRGLGAIFGEGGWRILHSPWEIEQDLGLKGLG